MAANSLKATLPSLPTGLLGMLPNSRILAEMWLLSEKWSCWNRTNCPGGNGPAIMYTIHTHPLMYTIYSSHALTCSHMLTHILHTCCSCKWYFLSSLICAFSSRLSSAGERQLPAEGSPPLWDGDLGHFSVGEGEEWVRCSFGQAKYCACVMHLCGGCEAAAYLRKALKSFDGSTLHAKHTLEGRSGYAPPSRKLRSLRAHFLVVLISVNICVCSQVSIIACKLCHQDHQICTKSKNIN